MPANPTLAAVQGFALGATLASASWFYGLGYEAVHPAPVFARPAAYAAAIETA